MMNLLRKIDLFVVTFIFSLLFISDAFTQLQPPSARVEPGNGCATVYWEKVPGATGYNVYWGPSPKINTFNYFQMKVNIPYVTDSFKQVQLSNDIRYYFVVQAYSNKGNSYGSSVVSTIPSANPKEVPDSIIIRPFGNSITFGIGFAEDTYCPVYFDNQKSCGFPPPFWGGGYRGWMTLISQNNQNLVFTTEGAQGGGSNARQYFSSTKMHDGYPGFWTNHMIERSKAPSKADVTLVHLGTNDLFWGSTADKAADTLFFLLDNILAANTNPNKHIYVAKIIKVFPSSIVHANYAPFVNAKIDAYNQLIDSKWKALPTEKKNLITVVDMHSVLDSSRYYADGVHPNEEGYLRMACTWIRAIKGMDPNPTDPCSGVTDQAVISMMPSEPKK